MAYKQIIFPDLSHWKPVQDFAKAKATYPLLISKATQGTGFVDKTLKPFIAGCEKYEIPYWIYYFATNGKEVSGARFMVETCKPLVGKHFVGYIIDIEKNPDNGTYPTVSGCHEALYYLASQCEKTMVYVGHSDYKKYSYVIKNRPENCAYWEARYWNNDSVDDCGKVKNLINDDVDVHQFSSQYVDKNDGITNYGDMSHTTGTIPDAWFTEPHVWKNGIKYEAGNRYTVARECFIHEKPAISSAIVKAPKKKDSDGDEKLDVGATVKAMEVKRMQSGAVWIRIPKGWVRAYAVKKNKTYLK